jgi:hypothetical protein
MHRSKRALSRTIFVPRSSETEPEKKSEIVRRRLSLPAVRACAAVGRMGRIRAASSTLVHGAWSTRTRLSAQSVRACVIRPRTNEGAPVGSRSKWRATDASDSREIRRSFGAEEASEGLVCDGCDAYTFPSYGDT